MTKLLLTTVLICAGLSNPALADNTIPAAFHGEWCSLNGTYYLPRAAIEQTSNDVKQDTCSKDSDGWIKITTNRYDGWEQWCKPTKVTKLSSSGKGFYSYAIKLRCTEGGETEFMSVELERTPGKEGFGKRLYIKNND